MEEALLPPSIFEGDLRMQKNDSLRRLTLTAILLSLGKAKLSPLGMN